MRNLSSVESTTRAATQFSPGTKLLLPICKKKMVLAGAPPWDVWYVITSTSCRTIIRTTRATASGVADCLQLTNIPQCCTCYWKCSQSHHEIKTNTKFLAWKCNHIIWIPLSHKDVDSLILRSVVANSSSWMWPSIQELDFLTLPCQRHLLRIYAKFHKNHLKYRLLLTFSDSFKHLCSSRILSRMLIVSFRYLTSKPTWNSLRKASPLYLGASKAGNDLLVIPNVVSCSRNSFYSYCEPFHS